MPSAFPLTKIIGSLLLGWSFAGFAQAQSPARQVTSADGTRIAYEKVGKGPALVIVGGALSDRKGGAELAQLLAPRFSVYLYDRRGRGER